jgi:hypothetical protein
MPIELNPGWSPLAFPIAVGTPFFEPVLLHEKGFLIAGGPDGLVIFAVGRIRGIFGTIRKRSWIHGFSVHGTVLYVQDGPVLLAYELTYCNPAAAINLVTGEHWPENEGDDISGGPPPSIFNLDAPRAALQETLYAARRHHASLHAGQAEPAPGLLTASQARLDAAMKAAERIVFSAPAIRTRMVDSRRYGQVFSLRMDGKVHAMDDNLTEAQTFAGPAPLRPELVMAEMPQPSGEVLCNLYYIGANGSIVGIDATGDLKPLRDWPAKGAVTPAKVLPLKFADGHLMGGGILGHDFFVLRPDSSQPPVVTVAGPAGGWKHYDVAPAEKLVLMSDGQDSRLVSYHRDAGTRDRWQLRHAPTRAYSLFWTETGSDAVLPGPKLSLEVSLEAPDATHPPEVRVVFANTVDSPNDGFRTNYPPPSTTLATATFTPGPFAGRMQPLASFPSRPMITQQMMFCIYRATPLASPTGAYFLTMFALNGLLGAVLPAANAKLDEMKQDTTPIRIHVTRLLTVDREWPEPGARWTEGPFVQNNTRMTLVPAQGARVDITTDNDGFAMLDAKLSGRHINIDCGTLNIPATSLGCGGVTLVSGRVNELRIEQYISRFK